MCVATDIGGTENVRVSLQENWQYNIFRLKEEEEEERIVRWTSKRMRKNKKLIAKQIIKYCIVT